MQNNLKREAGRACGQLRPLKATFDVFGYAASSVLFEVGATKVLCSVSLQQGVPPFLRGTNSGWLAAEYAMLPTATEVRTQRESATMKKSGRSVEISRLISRVLRCVVDLQKLGEKTIVIDCDVLQADGGTRTACISAANIALERAVAVWLANKQISQNILVDSVAAISAGVFQGHAILDPDFYEDSAIDCDFNFVFTRSGNIIEMQGTAEKSPISWQQFDHLKTLALNGTQQIFSFFDTLAKPQIGSESLANVDLTNCGSGKKNAPLFSLANRANVT